MKYSKPEVNTLGPAVKAIESSVQDKGIQTLRDANPPHVFNATPNAYEADE